LLNLFAALNSSISQKERLDALFKALDAFDHVDQALHDEEIEAGADIALVKCLVFLEFKTGFRRQPIEADLEAITREISMACQALEMVYRGSSEAVGRSFERVSTDLLHILVILIDEEVKSRMQAFSPNVSPESGPKNEKETNQRGPNEKEIARDDSRPVTPPPFGNAWGVGSADRDLMLRKATKILGHYARVGDATRPIAHFPGLLGSVLNLVNMRPYDAVPWEARLSCLWTIANLACNTDNMIMMMCTPGLINAMINVGFRQCEPSDPLERTMEVLRARSIASRALLNLSWPPENKIPMAENMALVRVLCQLAIQRRPPFSRSRTMQDIMTQTRRHSIGAIRNLAAAPWRSKIVLCEYNNGKILDILTDAALNDSDDKVVNLSFAAIHNLAIHDTAQMIVDRPALVLALKSTLLAEEEAKNGSDSPRSHASSTLLVLERSITPAMSSYDNLRELLDAINPSTQSDDDPESVTDTAEV
jgi:hypothetical protein